MKSSEMKVGMHVTISKDITKTHEVHGLGNGMSTMKGKPYKIEDIQTNDRGCHARICGYSWHPDDLTEASFELDPEPFHFDIKELII